jgi:antitoxin component YwqK of YwqJK toxin-antitoxin module
MVCKPVFFYVIYFLIFNASYCFSQKKEINPNGPNKFYYSNGKVSSEGIMLEGKPEGYWKTYFPSGVVKSEGNRVHHLLEGKWIFYTDSAKVKNELFYRKGKKDSVQKTFFSNGQVQVIENYKEDKRDGISIFFDENGHKLQTVNFKESLEEGWAKEYNEDTLVTKLSLYKNGYIVKEESINKRDTKGWKQGIWKTFYNNDKTKWEGQYSNNKKNGFFKEYDTDGNLIKKEEYADDILVVNVPKEVVKLDFRKEYYPSGQLKKQGGYNQQVAEGIFIEYAEDGTINGTITYRKGIKWKEGLIDESGQEQGLWKEFYNSGQLRSVGSYENGKKKGNWKYYYVLTQLESLMAAGNGIMKVEKF